jgi:hypothetical protein
LRREREVAGIPASACTEATAEVHLSLGVALAVPLRPNPNRALISPPDVEEKRRKSTNDALPSAVPDVEPPCPEPAPFASTRTAPGAADAQALTEPDAEDDLPKLSTPDVVRLVPVDAGSQGTDELAVSESPSDFVKLPTGAGNESTTSFMTFVLTYAETEDIGSGTAAAWTAQASSTAHEARKAGETRISEPP